MVTCYCSNDCQLAIKSVVILCLRIATYSHLILSFQVICLLWFIYVQCEHTHKKSGEKRLYPPHNKNIHWLRNDYTFFVLWFWIYLCAIVSFWLGSSSMNVRRSSVATNTKSPHGFFHGIGWYRTRLTEIAVFFYSNRVCMCVCSKRMC